MKWGGGGGAVEKKEINKVRRQSELFLQKVNLQKLPWKVIKPTLFARETFLIT